MNLENMSDEFNLFYKCYFTIQSPFDNWVTPYPEMIKTLSGEELEIARKLLWEKMVQFEDLKDCHNLMNPYIKVVACDGDKRAIPFLKQLYKIYRSKHGKKFSPSELEKMRIIVVGARSEDEKRKARQYFMKSRQNYTYTCLLYTSRCI